MRAAVGLAMLALAGGCDRGGGSSGAPRFQLVCDSADTSDKSTLFCVRADTRNGDVSVVDIDRLPITSGASRAADEHDGTFQTVCDSTQTPQKADFRCLRIHARTGEIVVLRLTELPRWPRP
jgi:hypothetical protein